FVPNNMILAVVGDVTADEAFAMTAKVFGSWPRVGLTPSQPAEPPPPTRRIVIVDKPDSVQTEIRVGQLAIPRKHPDFLAWDLAGSFPLTIETPNQIATQVLNTVFYDLPVAELATYRERVLAVTPDDVQRVARQYVRPDRLSIVLVGNARAFIPQLQAVGFTDL